MADNLDLRLSYCLKSSGGECLRRLALLGREMARAFSAADGGAVHAADVQPRLSALGVDIQDLRCRVHRGQPCPHRPRMPRYDREQCELWLGDELIHRFAPQAVNEIAVVTALEDQGWPDWIDDPLGNLADPGFAKRLHDTTSALNRMQEIQRIRFSSTAVDRKIRWELIERARKRRPRRKGGGQ